MRFKLIMLAAAIIGVVALAIFSFGLKERALRGMVDDVSEYNCGKDNICTSCIIEGNSCSCGAYTCICGNKTVDKVECEL